MRNGRPFFAFAVSLYRSDLLFRGLLDLAMSGFAILAFTGALGAALQPVKSAFNSLLTAINQPAGNFGPGVTELAVRGVSDRGTGAMAAQTPLADQIFCAAVGNRLRICFIELTFSKLDDPRERRLGSGQPEAHFHGAVHLNSH